MEEKRLREYSLNAMLVRKAISGRGQRYESRESKKPLQKNIHMYPHGEHIQCIRVGVAGDVCMHVRGNPNRYPRYSDESSY